ncbi:pilus assembly protein PilZ [Sphingomonas sp. KR1UV-12]|uniref:Pilus assembly protein PilZ n=1 Tax=Sphingomonas aurea TaxID=3063994 RepID=A0ABT9EM62_9SPHN|nr:pilus assembly protein PilZ [Sphingomonas sp. KR1UV-12]MDP1028049.1 pilus assembly protein PilZ [Sphingomonas sp. KR1UV-12]
MERPVFNPPFAPAPPPPGATHDRRDTARRSVRMHAHLRDRGQTRFDIDVSDLSTTGFRAATAFTLYPGTIVWLTLPGLAPIEAVVAWHDRYHYGCTFARPLHPAVFDHIVGMSH